MTVRRVEIERLELRLAPGALKGADRSAHALDALGRAVGAQLAARLGAAALNGPVPRRIEVTVPGGAGNPRKLAEAIDGRMRRGSAAPRQGGR